MFRLTPPPTFCKSFTCNWDETIIFNFPGPPNGFLPLGEIAFDASGNLYGATYYGGGNGSGGTVYQLTPAKGTWTQTLLVAFESGESPYGGVQLDQAGNVYGTTEIEGSVFEMVPSGSSWTRYVLYNFPEDSNYELVAGVILGPDGNLYGGSSDGDPNPILYELTPSNGGWTYNTIYTLGGVYCCGLSANLVMDTAGNLYGTTLGGYQGNGYGSVFELSPSNGGWVYTDLHDFTGGSDGGDPYSSIVIDSAGNLYGTASTGGSNGYGTVWEVTP